MPCRVLQVIDNLTDIIVILATPGGDSGHSQLYLRFKRADWQPYADAQTVSLRLDPSSLLPLHAGAIPLEGAE